jgi:hypothetical protein
LPSALRFFSLITVGSRGILPYCAFLSAPSAH